MRTIAKTGFPLIVDGVRYKTLTDDPDEKQKEYFETFIFSLEESLIKEFPEFEEFDLISGVLTEEIFTELVASDTSFSVFSVMLVYCYCVFHL